MTKYEPKFLWLLDNGHGGIIDGIYQTLGKRSPMWPDGTQLFEGEFNRAIIDRVAEMCTHKGLRFVKIAPGQNDMPLPDRTNLANEIFRQEYNKENGILPVFLSVHANGFKNSNAKGWEVYTSEGETKSDKFATIFYRGAENEFGGHKFRSDRYDGDPDKESQFWVLRKTVMPALLTENFFMTNYENCKILLSEDGRDRIAQFHFAAMLKCEEELNYKI